ncbi:MAG: ABC transporter ATP-binding protein, partial [Clostridia bacterium]|nr:ABC transporter ATP-binding protein [Clostridia bacterium]
MIKRLAACVREFKKPSLLTSVTVSLEVVMEVLIPYITASLIDKGIEQGNMPVIIKYGIILVVSAFLVMLFGFLAAKYAATASAGLARNLRHDMYYNIQNFSFTNIDKYSTGGIVTRLTTDVNNVTMAYQMIIRMAVRSPM